MLVDIGADIAWLTPPGWGARFPSGLPALVSSRDLLDWGVRRCVAALPNVRFIERADVVGLLPAGDSVAGVRLRSRGGKGVEERVYADLVIDAGGRSSRTPRWLQQLGYDAPEETVVDARLGYASLVYRRPPRADGYDWKVAAVMPVPPADVRNGLIVPVEGGRWMVSLAGGAGDYPPTDEAGFLEFARSLRDPIIHDAIRGAEPLSPIVGYRRAENRRRHYEQLARWPERLVVTGDAVCALNPAGTQGMTVAAMAAEELDRCLRKARGDLAGLAGRFQRRLARMHQTPWTFTASFDHRYPGVVGAPETTRCVLQGSHAHNSLM